MPNQLPVTAYQVPNQDEMITIAKAAAFGKVLGKLGFSVNRIVVMCVPNVSSEAQEVAFSDVPFTEPVNCVVFIDGQTEKAALNVARTEALYHGANLNGPSVASYSALWAMLNPGRTQAEAQAALLHVPAVSSAVKSTLVALG